MIFKIDTDRLRSVCDQVEGMPEGHFDYGVWFDTNYNECGTVGCLGGWAENLTGLSANSLIGYSEDANEMLFHGEAFDVFPAIGYEASREEVLARCRLFCDRVDAGEIPEHVKGGLHA